MPTSGIWALRLLNSLQWCRLGHLGCSGAPVYRTPAAPLPPLRPPPGLCALSLSLLSLSLSVSLVKTAHVQEWMLLPSPGLRLVPTALLRQQRLSHQLLAWGVGESIVKSARVLDYHCNPYLLP